MGANLSVNWEVEIEMCAAHTVEMCACIFIVPKMTSILSMVYEGGKGIDFWLSTMEG